MASQGAKGNIGKRRPGGAGTTSGGNSGVGNIVVTTITTSGTNGGGASTSGVGSASTNSGTGSGGGGAAVGGLPLPVTADLASLFECPVCFDYVLPPILQCQSGHLVCSNCRPKLSCCPTCRGPLGKLAFANFLFF